MQLSLNLSLTRTTLLAFAIGASVAASAFIASSADARRTVVLAAPPSSIGVVDLKAVFDLLPESAEWDVKVQSLEAKFSDEVRARKAELEQLAKEIEAMAEGPAREAKLDAARLRKLQIEQWAGFKDLELDRERSLKWQAIYRLVRDAAKQLAIDEKYDLVLVDDSNVEVRTQRGQNAPPLETQAQSQISQIRVLYAGKTIDVTQKIIVQVKNRAQQAPVTKPR